MNVTAYAASIGHSVWFSHDLGESWSGCELGNATECDFINTPRMTSIQFDPREPDTVWTTIEIDGIYRSRDRRRWRRGRRGSGCAWARGS